jgi:chloramphenicol O-acetyltransferase type A
LPIPPRFAPSPLSESERQGWLAWSLPFFTDPTHPQNPHLSITLPLDVTAALRRHRAGDPGATFFAWLAWSLLQVMAAHPAFLLRQVREEWWLIRNPPLVVPVAVGGRQRFVELVLEDVIAEPWPHFAARYSRGLQALRAGEVRRADSDAYNLGVVVGNLPNLPFTGFSLHNHGGDAAGRCVFYVGQRSERDGVTTMPLAVQLHHATADPYVLDQLLRDWRHRYLDDLPP